MHQYPAVAVAGGGRSTERWSSPRVSVAAARATAARAAARAAAARAVAVRAAAKAVAAKAAVARAWIQVHVTSLASPTRSTLDAVCTAALHARSDAALDATASLFLQLAAQDRAVAPPQAAAASGAHAEGCGPQATEVAQAAEAALFEGDALCTERLPAASGSCLHDAASLFLQLAPGDCTQALAAPPTPAARPTPGAPQTPGRPGAPIITTSRDYYGSAGSAAALTPTTHTCERSRRGRARGADAGYLTISVRGVGPRPFAHTPWPSPVALAPTPPPLPLRPTSSPPPTPSLPAPTVTPRPRPHPSHHSPQSVHPPPPPRTPTQPLPSAPLPPTHPNPLHEPSRHPPPTRCPTRSNAVAPSRRSHPPPPTRRAVRRRGAAGM